MKALADQVSRNHYPLKGSQKRSRLEALRKGQIELPEEVPLGLKRRGKKPKTIGLDQKLQILERVLIDGESQSDVAKDFRVSQPLVSNLITKVRKKPELMRELISKRAEKQLEDLDLADFIEGRME